MIWSDSLPMQTSRQIKTICYQFDTTFGHCAAAYQDNPFRLVQAFLPCATKKRLKEKLEGMRLSRSRHPAQIFDITRTIEHYFCGHRLSIPWMLNLESTS